MLVHTYKIYIRTTHDIYVCKNGICIGAKMIEINISLRRRLRTNFEIEKIFTLQIEKKTTFISNIFLPDVPFQVLFLIPPFLLKF